jgi:hypothetical protein
VSSRFPKKVVDFLSKNVGTRDYFKLRIILYYFPSIASDETRCDWLLKYIRGGGFAIKVSDGEQLSEKMLEKLDDEYGTPMGVYNAINGQEAVYCEKLFRYFGI